MYPNLSPSKSFKYTSRCICKWGAALLILLCVLFTPKNGFCQVENGYEEITINLNISRIGITEIPALIQGETIYLPVKDVFDFLKIRNIMSEDMDSISGFFINPSATYVIDKTAGDIIYQGKFIKIKDSDLIRTPTNLYLKADYFGDVFGLQCSFSFRSLSVNLITNIELPQIREMRLEQMRRSISTLKGERKADTTIGRSYPFFNVGMADWFIASTQQLQGMSNTIVNLTLGATVAGGEATVSLNYNDLLPFDEKRQSYRWRFVNDESKVLTQVIAGKITPQAISAVFDPVVGIQLTNTPTTYRRSFGTYRISNTTEPGWMVELYVNNVLVNYMKSDASGFYSFDVPMVYGNSQVQLKFYGPLGEERVQDQAINLPFNFLPVNELEYTFSAGVVQDDSSSHFSRLNFNYGLTRRLTFGGGVEYVSSINSGKIIPFANASFRLANNILITTDYINQARLKTVFTYRLPSNIQLNVEYSKYKKGETIIKNSYTDERKASISMPFRGKNFSAFTRLSYNRYSIDNVNSTIGNLLVSSIYKGISTNLTTGITSSGIDELHTYSNLSVSFRAAHGINIKPQLQYEYGQKNLSLIKCEIDKLVFKKAYVSLAVEKNSFSYSLAMSFRYDLSFAQTMFSAAKNGDYVTLAQSARGSFLFDNQSKYFSTDNRGNVGRGGIIISPFLDLNCNGIRDKDEPKVAGLKLKSSGGKLITNKKDTTIIITGIEAYTSYYIDFDRNSFDNISWQLKKKSLSVAIEPNNMKLVEIPVAVVGEVSGSVYVKAGKGLNGIGRLFVNIYDSTNTLVAKTLTEADGYFSYVGLAPGSYTASIDFAQLIKLKMTCANNAFSFKILKKIDGDVAEDLKFIVSENSSRPKQTADQEDPQQSNN